MPDPANDETPRRALRWDDQSDELVTYRYFGCRSTLVDRNHSTGSMPIRSDMRASGGLLVAPMAIAMLEAAGNTLDRYYQLWLTQIDVHLFEAGMGVEQVAIDNKVLREARTQAFTEGRLMSSPNGRILGQGSASWAVLGHLSSDFEYRSLGGSPDEAQLADIPPLHEVFGATRHPQGGYSILGLSPRIGASVLHHGPILVLLEQASLDLARSMAGSATIRPKMMSCRIIRAGRKGPFKVRAELFNHSGDVITCRATVSEGPDEDDILAVMQWQARIL